MFVKGGVVDVFRTYAMLLDDEVDFCSNIT